VYVGRNAKFFCAFDGLAWNFMDEWMARAGARKVRLQRWISEVSWRYGGCRLLLEPPVLLINLLGGAGGARKVHQHWHTVPTLPHKSPSA